MKKLENYIVLGIAAVLLIIIFGMTVVLLNGQSSPTPPPTPSTSQASFMYDTAAGERLAQKIKDRQPLSTTDATAKNKILSSLPQINQSGVVYKTSHVRILYIHELDVFQSEILTTDIPKAKSQATLWFQQQGMSQQGVCNLPIMFSIDSETEKLLKEKTVLNPLPEDC